LERVIRKKGPRVTKVARISIALVGSRKSEPTQANAGGTERNGLLITSYSSNSEPKKKKAEGAASKKRGGG